MRHFNVRHSPTKPTIINLMMRFGEQGFVTDRSRPGRGLSVRTLENTKMCSAVLTTIQPH